MTGGVRKEPLAESVGYRGGSGNRTTGGIHREPLAESVGYREGGWSRGILQSFTRAHSTCLLCYHICWVQSHIDHYKESKIAGHEHSICYLRYGSVCFSSILLITEMLDLIADMLDSFTLAAVQRC